MAHSKFVLEKDGLLRRGIMGRYWGLLFLLPGLVLAEPPYSGTISIDSDIITTADPTTFSTIQYTGTGTRTMFDRRVNDWVTVDAFLFDVTFDDGLSTEVQVNPEFISSDAAAIPATKYATEIGRIPTALRADMQTMWIHKGNEAFGGGNNNVLIHTEQADAYEADGILHETFVHEAAHTSIDATHDSSVEWLAAQGSDPDFISTYARDNPNREDIAESMLPYLAVRYRADRISADMKTTIEETMPARIAYLDAQNFDMYPIATNGNTSAGPTAATMYLMTTSNSNNVTTLHLINTSSAAQTYTGTLYNGDGDQLGVANETLNTTGVPASGRLKLTALDLETIFSVTAWKGPAMLEVNSADSFHLMAKLVSPSGLVSNTNCVRSNEVHNVEGFDSPNLTYVRFINTGASTISNITATLKDDNGEDIGAPATVLLNELAPKAATWLNRNDLADLIDDTWNGEATLKIIDGAVSLKLLNLNFVNSETFFNFSCYEGQ